MQSVLDIYNIKEYIDGVNAEFYLEDDSHFSITDYKVIRGQIKDGLARCEKVLFNGKIKLFYFMESYTSLENLLPCMNEKVFVSVFADIIKVFHLIKENGFLEYQKLLLDSKYIYVDVNTMKVKLIYLPVSTIASYSFMQLNQIRSVLINLLHRSTLVSSATIQKLTMLIAEESLPLQEIYNEIINQWNHSDIVYKPPKIQTNRKRRMNLLSVSPDYPVKFQIDSRNFSIGRDPGRVDGAIIGSPVVGRKHCGIIYQDKKYYIEDYGSKNGTFLNEEKLVQGQPKEIRENAFIRVANVTFKITYDE